MKINWALRLKNKTTLVALLTAIVAFVYQILGMFGVVAPVSQSEVVNVIGLLINILCMLGIVTDPTTSGVSDSTQAMDYTEPK